MEVDLLCTDAPLVIELDGSQHLDSQEAYRRDRRKDFLLQQHGYFVLRFLAEDVGKELNSVLDAILSTIQHLRVLGSTRPANPDSKSFGSPEVASGSSGT
jgi:very-short-patch-repair endonuclease